MRQRKSFRHRVLVGGSAQVRHLVWIPILHTAAELGSFAAEAQRRHGADGWHKLQAQVEAGWDEVRIRLLGLGLDWQRVRIYQDALPAGGEVGHRVAAELAATGSRNHRLLLELVGMGAALEATEDLALLKAEMDLLRQGPGPGTKAKAAALLQQRDRHIALRVDATLAVGETGVLFIGAAHNIRRWLAADIRVRQLSVNWSRTPGAPAP